MDSSISEVQFADPGEGSHTNQAKFHTDVSSYRLFMDSDDDMQTDGTHCTTKHDTSFKSEEGMDSSDAAYGSYESTSGCLPLPPGNITSTSFDSMKLSSTIESNDEAQTHEEMDSIKLEASHEDNMDMHENSELLGAKSEEMFSVDTLISEVPCTNEPGQRCENSAVSESVEASTSDETPVKHEMEEMYNSETTLELKVLSNEMSVDPSLKQDKDVLKLDTLSDDEEVSFPKSGAESSSSKDESPSRPSCSGTSHRDLNSLSSDSEADLPDINMTLPLKKRKRDSLVETISSSSSSCSEDEDEAIDYANLTPEQIKALIEQAKNIKHKCLCPKRKWADLPEKGPTQPPKHCHVGKGDWREKHPCTECLGGVCTEPHKPGRSGRKRYTHTRSALAKTRLRGTIGQDVPIIELSDEEGSPVSNRVASEVTITTAPAGECIVLSSSDDDSDIVCEGVIKAKPKPQEPKTLLEGGYLLSGSPDVVVLSVPPADGAPGGAAAAAAAARAPPADYITPPTLALPALPAFPVAPVPTDLDLLWPELDNYTWNEMNLLCDNIIGPPNAGGMAANTSQANASAAVPERPSSPEGWSCPICLESKTAVPEIMSTTCGHIFCGTCIRSAVRIHKKCPTCRKKLTAKQFHKIFL